MTRKIVSLAVRFAGSLAAFRLSSEPDSDSAPIPTIELAGTLSIPDAPTGIAAERAAHVRITRARRSHFSIHVLKDETCAYLRVGDDDFEFLMRAMIARPQGRVEIVGSVEIDPLSDQDKTRFDVSYFDLSVG